LIREHNERDERTSAQRSREERRRERERETTRNERENGKNGKTSMLDVHGREGGRIHRRRESQ
jgi:hypothetical protein